MGVLALLGNLHHLLAKEQGENTGIPGHTTCPPQTKNKPLQIFHPAEAPSGLFPLLPIRYHMNQRKRKAPFSHRTTQCKSTGCTGILPEQHFTPLLCLLKWYKHHTYRGSRIPSMTLGMNWHLHIRNDDENKETSQQQRCPSKATHFHARGCHK